MFTKKNYILFIILLVLAGAAYVYTTPYQNWREERRNHDSKNFLSRVDISAVDRIAVTQPDENQTYTITRSNGLWLMQPDNWPTEQILMDALEEKIANIAAGELQLASINAGNQANFGVTETAPHVRLYQGQDEIASFVIGNLASDYQSTYIGRENDPNTYSIPETLVRAFDVESWPDRTITNLNSASVDTVIFSYAGQEPVELTNQAAVSGEVYWRVEKPLTVRLNKDRVEEFLNVAGKLEAIAIPEQTDVTPELTLALTGSGVNETLIIGSKIAGGNYLLKQENTGRVYEITADKRNVLFKQIRDLQ